MLSYKLGSDRVRIAFDADKEDGGRRCPIGHLVSSREMQASNWMQVGDGAAGTGAGYMCCSAEESRGVQKHCRKSMN